jgi:hypothetical protein
MPWNDLGVVFQACGQQPWMRSHAYVPTACLQGDRIRVFAAFWDENNTGRVGFVDLRSHDPTSVIGYSREPVLDIGAPGSFDEHGTTPMAVVADGDALKLYYAGWQRSPTVRYLIFTGLAVSEDEGASFARVSDVPILDRVPGHHLVRTGFIDRHGPVWKAWIAESEGLAKIAGKMVPSYSLNYIESADGLSWPSRSRTCFSQGSDGIFGYGRSCIWRDSEGYHAMLSVRRAMGYRIEYARSEDGETWTSPGLDGFALLPDHTIPTQAETMFPSVVRVAGVLYAFYNGDAFGREGMRCARWSDRED